MSSATQNCEFCGSPAHVWFACTKKPDGWKPDRLKERSKPEPIKSAPKQPKAPPVDTLKQAEAAASHLAPKRGRPKTITDMRAYKREKERARRMAKKEAAK